MTNMGNDYTVSEASNSGALVELTRTEGIQWPAPGERVGKLRIIDTVEAGGMAIVYKARHEELEVTRAIKMLKPGFNDESKDRLQTEAKIAANLHHPNIVQIYDVGYWRYMIPYIEMEFVDGTSLRHMLTTYTRLPFTVALAIGHIVATALEFARQQSLTVYGKTYQGVVHRDVKPANILISCDGVVKLADFGIALPGSVSLHTMGPLVLGTFSYISPEQINGHKLDHRSDIYSLGTVLYEMISGEKAFMQRTIPEVMHAKNKGKYPPLSETASDVPPSVAEIVSRCLAVSKRDRFASAGELAAVLAKALAAFTDEPPVAVVLHYVQSRGTAFVHTIGAQHQTRSNRRFLLLCAVSLAVMISALLSIIGLINGRSIRWPRRPISAPSVPAPALPPSTASWGAAPEPLVPAMSSAPIVAAVKRRALSDTMPSSPPPISHRTAAVPASQQRANNSGLLEKLQLFEKCLDRNDLAGAQRLASGEQIDDGQFYLLSAETYARSANFERAAQLFERAQTMPSILGSGVRREAMFRLAINREAMYRKKPNAENRKLALQAWNTFISAFCRSDETATKCEEAIQRSTLLSR